MSASLNLDPKKTALVLIDLQNGIVSRDTKPYTPAEVIERSRTLAEAFRAKGAPARCSPCLTDEAMNVPKNIPAEASEIAASAGMQSGDLLITKRQRPLVTTAFQPPHCH